MWKRIVCFVRGHDKRTLYPPISGGILSIGDPWVWCNRCGWDSE